MKLYSNDEIQKFSRISSEWWSESGKFKLLHQINPARVKYILTKIRTVFGADLSELSVLDVGCGGGLVAEPLAKVGLNITAIDASEENIKVAIKHSEEMGINNINYRVASIENLTDEKYDIILALEVLEHVENIDLFMEKIFALVNNGGLVIFSTINRTVKSFALAIIAAEYLLNLVPRKTHDWNKLIKPSEIMKSFRKNNIELIDLSGMNFNIIQREWHFDKNISVNYIISGIKK